MTREKVEEELTALLERHQRGAVDLARIREIETELAALLEAHPELKERTARYLAGELAGRGDARAWSDVPEKQAGEEE